MRPRSGQNSTFADIITVQRRDDWKGALERFEGLVSEQREGLLAIEGELEEINLVEE